MKIKINFGTALEAVKQGKLIAREGWNGKGMFVFQRPEDALTMEFIPKVKSLPESVKNWLEKNVTPDNNITGEIKFTAYLCLKAADGSIVNGWTPNILDVLAEDWIILD
jgi:hypothetical protein